MALFSAWSSVPKLSRSESEGSVREIASLIYMSPWGPVSLCGGCRMGAAGQAELCELEPENI